MVKDETRQHFGQFYVSLFDHTLAQHERAVVTEYAWSASSCDPCPEEPLSVEELIVLGADSLPRYADGFDEQGQLLPDSDMRWKIQSDFVLTRLHARYDKASLGEDLVFQTAPGIAGGQGMPHDGKLATEVHETGDWNSFQGRYAILHYWEGSTRCLRPLYDTWGGPPEGHEDPGPALARQLAFESRDAKLASFVTNSSHQSLKLEGAPPPDERPERVQETERETAEREQEEREQQSKSPEAKRGCSCTTASTPPGGALACLLGLLLVRRRPR